MNETDESLFALDEQAYRVGVEREVNEEIKSIANSRIELVAAFKRRTLLRWGESILDRAYFST